MTKISIVTIAYNCIVDLKKTIYSVNEQNGFESFEHIIIDGGSHDGTKELLKEFGRMPYRRYISEKDNGRYDAMNKGIRLAEGEWILFLNAGDVFASETILKEIGSYLDSKYDIIYGSTMMHSVYGDYVAKPQSIEYLNKGMAFCHQSCLIKASYHKQHQYDTSFVSSGDYNFFYNAYKDSGCKFLEVPCIISIFDAIGGISSTNFFTPKKEDLRIWKKEHNLFSLAGMYITCFISYLRFRTKRMLPHNLQVQMDQKKLKRFMNTGHK